MEVWPRGLWRNFAKVERAKALRRFESCHFRVNHKQIDHANRQNKAALREELALLTRVIVLTEKSALNAGILLIPATDNNRSDVEQDDDEIVADMLEGLPYTVRGPKGLIEEIKWYPEKDINLDLEALKNRAEYIQYRIDLIDKLEADVV